MDAGSVTFLLVFLIGIAFLFDLLNGMHDAANSIATIVSTRVLSPFIAVLWAAFFNFAAYFIGHYLGTDTTGEQRRCTKQRRARPVIPYSAAHARTPYVG